MKKLWTWITQGFKKRPKKHKYPVEGLMAIKATLGTMPVERNSTAAIERVSKTGLTDKQKWIYEYVESCGDRFVSPTEVAKKYGMEFKGKELESNFSSPILTFLVTEGLLEKNKKGHYKKTK
jgi:hypothetical protein